MERFAKQRSYTMALETLLTKRDVREITKYHEQHIMKLVRGKKFPEPIRLNGYAVRWRASDVAAWIDQHVGGPLKRTG